MDQKTPTIRLATDADYDNIYAIWLEGIENSFDRSPEDHPHIEAKFRQNFEQRHGIFNFWVATDAEGHILGWQSLTKFSNNPFCQTTHAESSTYLAKQTRFKGLGKQLLAHALQEAEKSSLEYVMGFVSLANEAAKKATRETGWIEVGAIPRSKKGKNTFTKSLIVRPV